MLVPWAPTGLVPPQLNPLDKPEEQLPPEQGTLPAHKVCRPGGLDARSTGAWRCPPGLGPGEPPRARDWVGVPGAVTELAVSPSPQRACWAVLATVLAAMLLAALFTYPLVFLAGSTPSRQDRVQQAPGDACTDPCR